MRLSPLKKLFKEHFATKVFVFFVILMLAASLSFTAFFINRQGNSMRADLSRYGYMLSKLLAYNSRIGVFSENKEMLKDVAAGIIQQENVLEASLYNEKGDLLYEQENYGSKARSSSSDKTITSKIRIIKKIEEGALFFYGDYDGSLVYWYPVISESTYATDPLFLEKETSERQEKKIIGFVRLAVDETPMFNKLNSLLINSSVIGFCLLIIGSAFVYVLIRGITGPLHRLTEGVRKLDRGEGVEMLPEETSDEIGKLAAAFNTMTESLSNREAALRDSEEKYRQLFELESDAIFLIEDGTGRILEVNKTASMMYGYTRDELLRMNEAELFSTQTKINNSFTEGSPIIPVDYHRKKDGSVFSVETSLSRLSFQGRDVYISAVRDVTDRLRAEEERIKLEVKLRQSQKMEAIGTLAGGIAHDFNNVLGIIVVNTELVMYEIPEGAEIHENLEEIMKACLRARDMVRQILAFSRKDEARTKPIMIKPLIKESIKLFRSSILDNIEIEQDLNAESDIVMADPTQMHQILMNLYNNAAYVLKETGGVIGVSLKNIDIQDDRSTGYPGLAKGKYLLLSVSDTGEGIHPEILERIFEPYFTTKKFGEGSGMGLAIAHGIVKSHGGIITVESKPGRGAVFNVVLPVVEADIKFEEEYEMFCPSGNERLLFVDDEKPITDAMNIMLTRLGYTVTSRTSSIDALKTFRENKDAFDLVITDLVMPHMTGVELSKEISSIKPDIPIILCTGYSEMIDDEMINQAGIKYRTTKPLVMSEMANVIREALDNHGKS
jgi:two-component system, cell cycle sensor histidine kinase and response regulator CckA